MLHVLINNSVKSRNETKSNDASDGSVTLANGGMEVNLLGTCGWDTFKLYLVRNWFYFFTYFLFHIDVVFCVVCKFEIPCEWEIL